MPRRAAGRTIQIDYVSWNDAQVFLTRLNEQQADNLPIGWEYALPTEAEW